MIFETCAVLLTIGILIFLVFAIRTLKKTSDFLDIVGPDLQNLLSNTSDVADDVRLKLDDLNPAFRLINSFTSSTEDQVMAFKERSFSNLSASRVKRAEEISDKVFKIIDLITLAVEIWQKKRS